MDPKHSDKYAPRYAQMASLRPNTEEDYGIFGPPTLRHDIFTQNNQQDAPARGIDMTKFKIVDGWVSEK